MDRADTLAYCLFLKTKRNITIQIYFLVYHVVTFRKVKRNTNSSVKSMIGFKRYYKLPVSVNLLLTSFEEER